MKTYALYYVLMARLVYAAMQLPVERRRPLFNRWRVWREIKQPELFREAMTELDKEMIASN